MNTQKPQYASRASYQLLAVLATIMLIGGIVIAIVAYNFGYHQGQNDYTHNNCVVYPFLLLPSNQFWACRIPQEGQ